jgi:hypothetical protein
LLGIGILGDSLFGVASQEYRFRSIAFAAAIF